MSEIIQGIKELVSHEVKAHMAGFFKVLDKHSTQIDKVSGALRELSSLGKKPAEKEVASANGNGHHKVEVRKGRHKKSASPKAEERPCAFIDCKGHAISRGFCSAHYQRIRYREADGDKRWEGKHEPASVKESDLEIKAA